MSEWTVGLVQGLVLGFPAGVVVLWGVITYTTRRRPTLTPEPVPQPYYVPRPHRRITQLEQQVMQRHPAPAPTDASWRTHWTRPGDRTPADRP